MSASAGAYALALPCLSVPVLTFVCPHSHPHDEQGECRQGQMRGHMGPCLLYPVHPSPCSFTHPHACTHPSIPLLICLSPGSGSCVCTHTCLICLFPPLPMITCACTCLNTCAFVLVCMHKCSCAPAFMLICMGLDSLCPPHLSVSHLFMPVAIA